MEFGKRLQSLLEERNLSQKALAALLHTATSTMSGYVGGSRQPSYETLLQIAAYFEVSTDYLLGYSKLRHNMAEPLTEKEKLLLDLFRDLKREKQNLLIEQARFYHNLQNKKIKR